MKILIYISYNQSIKLYNLKFIFLTEKSSDFEWDSVMKIHFSIFQKISDNTPIFDSDENIIFLSDLF